MSIHGYRIINYPNLELDKFARVLVSYKSRQEAVSLICKSVICTWKNNNYFILFYRSLNSISSPLKSAISFS